MFIAATLLSACREPACGRCCHVFETPDCGVIGQPKNKDSRRQSGLGKRLVAHEYLGTLFASRVTLDADCRIRTHKSTKRAACALPGAITDAGDSPIIYCLGVKHDYFPGAGGGAKPATLQ